MAGDIEISGPDLESEGLALEDLHTEIPTVAHFEGKPVVVISTADGPRAVGGKCTHYGGPLGDGICAAGEIRCPWHHAAFDIVTGEAVGAPALNPIPVYDVEVRDGKVFVTGVGEVSDQRSSPPGSPESVVIVGSGAAGEAAAEALRRRRYTGPVYLIGEEAPIDRPNVSKDYLAGTAPEEWMPLRSQQFYEKASIELLTGRRVVSIDRASRTIGFVDGDMLTYGALLLAPGAEPRRLPVPGADLSHVHYLRTLEDSKVLISAAEEAKSAVVVGAGFIGLETAASLRHRGLEVTVVAPEEIPLAHLIGRSLGGFVEALHREHGVDFRLGRSVDRITEAGVDLDDGSSVVADVVVIGIGVAPRTALAEQAGLAVDNGIVVDDRLRTSDPHIWAAGDVARYPGPDGKPVRVEHWVLAQRQGQAAAANILGDDIAFREPPFFWSQHYDVPINVTGHLDGWDEEVVVGDPHERDVLVGFRKGGSVRAVASIYRDRESLLAEQALAVGDDEALDALVSG